LYLSHQDPALSGLLREGFWCPRSRNEKLNRTQDKSDDSNSSIPHISNTFGIADAADAATNEIGEVCKTKE